MARRVRRRSGRRIGLLPRLGHGLLDAARWTWRHPQPVVLGLFLVGLGWLLASSAQRLEAFRVTHVRLPADSSLTVHHSPLGANLWQVDLRALAADLKQQQPWWKDIRVIREPPNTIRVEPIPRVAIAQVALDQWYPLDAEGVLLPRGQASPDTRWVRLTGLERAAVKVGVRNTDERLRRALRILALLQRTRALTRHRLSEVNVADPHQVRFLLDDHLEIRCGDEPQLPAHLERLRAAFKAMGRHPISAGYIDVRFQQPVVSPTPH